MPTPSDLTAELELEAQHRAVMQRYAAALRVVDELQEDERYELLRLVLFGSPAIDVALAARVGDSRTVDESTAVEAGAVPCAAGSRFAGAGAPARFHRGVPAGG